MSNAFESALVDELAKKSWLVWIGYGGRTHPVWHVFVDGAICIVSGGEEQPLPGIEEQHEVTITLRSKATRHQVAQVRASVEVLTPESASWTAVTSALVSSRLNLVDQASAPDRWAAGSVVVRLVPTEVIAAPGSLGDGAQRDQPIETPAVTTVGRPFVVHRRQRVQPRLSEPPVRAPERP